MGANTRTRAQSVCSWFPAFSIALEDSGPNVFGGCFGFAALHLKSGHQRMADGHLLRGSTSVNARGASRHCHSVDRHAWGYVDQPGDRGRAEAARARPDLASRPGRAAPAGARNHPRHGGGYALVRLHLPGAHARCAWRDLWESRWEEGASLTVGAAKWVNESFAENVMRGFRDVQAANPDGHINILD